MKAIDAKTKDLKALNSALRELANGKPVRVKNAGGIHGLAAGMKHGEIIVEGEETIGLLGARVKQFMAANEVMRDRRGKVYNLRPLVQALAIEPAERTRLIARMWSPWPPWVISPVLVMPRVVP